jgi:hypothetical protein
MDKQNVSNELTFEEIAYFLDTKLEAFKRQRLCQDSVSVKEWYDKTLKEEERKISEIVKDSETLDLVLVHRKSNFELRRFTWQTLNKIRLFVAIREALTDLTVTDPAIINDITEQINDLVEEYKIYEEELYFVSLQELQIFEMIDDLFFEEEATQIKKIMTTTWENIVYKEAHAHIALTPACAMQLIKQLKDNINTEYIRKGL